MKPYEQALRDWFYPRAGVPSYYHPSGAADVEKTDELQRHLATCGIVWVSEPKLGQVEIFGGTFNEDDKVQGVVARVACNCSKTRDAVVTLFIPGEIPLGRIIAEVIEAGEED